MENKYYYGETLYHHGVKGQKWGLRKYQNEDGSLTAAGREHYGYGTESSRSKYKQAKKDYKAAKKAYGKAFDDAFDYETRHPISTMTNKAKRAEANRRWDDAEAKEKVKDSAKEAYKQAKQEYKNSDEYKARQEKFKKAAIAGAAVAATALAAYGAYKYSESQKNKKFAAAKEYGAKYYASMFDKFDTKAYAADRTVDRNMNYFHDTKAAAKEVQKSEHGYNNAGYSRSTRLNELADQYYNTAADAARRRSEYERSAQGFETKYNQYRNKKRR